MDIEIILGSKSDLPVLKDCISVLKQLKIEYNISIISAHRSPDHLRDHITRSDAKVFIAFAGLSAALPGFIASYTLKPVIGVPLSGKVPYDSLLSMAQLPKGVPVAVVGIDNAKNAALLAARILAVGSEKLADRLNKFQSEDIKNIEQENERELKSFLDQDK
ncbi:MAG: 5-(carboxyamino)imidazole ribonucleotide mutase [Thermoplasmata archaeon]